MTIFLCLLLIGLISVGLLAQRLSQQAQEEYVPIPVRVDEVDILARRRKRR